MKKYLLIIFISFLSILNSSKLIAQLSITSTTPSFNTYTSCNSNSFTGCSYTFNGRLIWRTSNVVGATITFNILLQNTTCTSYMNVLQAGTVYIKSNDACGTILASIPYSANTFPIQISHTFTSAGTQNVVAVIVTSSGTHYYSEPISVNVVAPTPTPPTLISPSNLSCVNYGSPVTFNWSNVGATSYIFKLYDAVSQNFIITPQTVTTNTYTFNLNPSLWQPNKKYYWTVQACNGYNNCANPPVNEFYTTPTVQQATSNSPVPLGTTTQLYSNNTDPSVTYSWSGSTTLPSITNPTIVNTQLTNAGNYTVTVSNSLGCSYTSSANVSIANSTPSLSVTVPNGGQSYSVGSTVNVQWAHNLITGNLQIELIDQSNNVVPNSGGAGINSIGTQGTGEPVSLLSKSWTIPNTIPVGQYKIKIYTLTNSPQFIDYSNNYFTITGTPSNCVSWTPSSPTIGNGSTFDIDQEAYDAMQYLCAKNIIQNPQFTNQINNNLRRDELAKITFKALFSPNGAGNPFVNSTTTFSDYFPVPYFDLQPPYTTYQKEAKAMCYLEYGDCVSPFDKDFTHFRPADTIWKKHALKEILEAFNIAPAPVGTPAPWASNYYTDLNPSVGEYYYIVKAYQLGIIGNATSFGNVTALTRRNAFRYLYKLLQLYDANSPLIGGGNKPVPQPSDYYVPFNQKVGNMNNLLGIDEGACNSYTKTSFGIAGKMPLVFEHSYNSANTNYPNSFNVFQPMGKGWNNNYNCYIKRFDNGAGADIRFTIFWGDGTMISFDSTGTNVFTPLDKGVYSSLAMSNGGNTFTFTTKSKVVYKFDKQNNLNRKTWCLTKINDRNNNNLNIAWQVVDTNLAQVNQVSDPQSRQLNFSYNANNKLSQLQCATGSIVRNVFFTYNAVGDLQTYSDPMGQSSIYIYYTNPTPCEEHLLKQIQLPKGNIIDNQYVNRKLVSSSFAGQYATTIVPNTTYVNGNNTNYTEATISTTQAGQTITTNIKHNELGNAVHIDDPTSSLDIGYTTVGQPTKPSSFTNTTNGITATTNYDPLGNVLSVTKNALSMPTISESFTYNSFNDILKHTNANNAITEFTYNGTGNLTKITDALGNQTNIIPNVDGTVLKVTNPSGYYTEYTYDTYGNTKQSTLMGTITSKADYDDASRLTIATNPNNVKTKYDYNNNNQVISVVYDFGNSNNTMSYTYDPNGNLTKVTNPKGDPTILTYNNQDQLTQYNFLGLTKSYTYNQNGTLSSFTDQNGVTFNSTYNANGTLASDGYATYGYSPTTNNLSTITSNINSSVISFGYDNYQRVNNINYNYTSGNNNVAYEYDNTNNITKITYPTGFAVKYVYDVLGRLYQVKNFATNAIFATYIYHADGRLQQCVNGNGTKTIYTYDSFGRLDSISNQTSSNAIICAYKFTLDNIGNHTSENANEPFAPAMPTIPSTTVAYTHSNTNRMTDQGTTHTTFNNNGNELSNTGALNATYTWDIKENLLTSTSPSLTCEYDGAENRRKRNNTRFVLDLLGDNILMETDLSGNPTAYYIQGLGLICRLDATQANPAYYHYDYRGSTTAITNTSQTVTHKYLYGSFGEQLAVAETGFANQFRYVGKYGVIFEDSTLYFMRARYYNPNKGRFLGEDPIANKNLYAYGENNPIYFTDPNGKKAQGSGYNTDGFHEINVVYGGTNPDAYLETNRKYNEKMTNFLTLLNLKNRTEGQTKRLKQIKLDLRDLSLQLEKDLANYTAYLINNEAKQEIKVYEISSEKEKQSIVNEYAKKLLQNAKSAINNSYGAVDNAFEQTYQGLGNAMMSYFKFTMKFAEDARICTTCNNPE